MTRNRWFRTVAAVACLAAASAASAQIKMAVINVQKAVIDTTEIKKAQAGLEAKFKGRQDQVVKLQTDLQSIQSQLQTMAGKLTPQAEQDLTNQGQRKQRDLQRLSDDLQSDVDRERNEILSQSSQKMQNVIKKLAEEKGLDMVVDASNTLFFKPALDLTADALAAYDKAYPAK